MRVYFYSTFLICFPLTALAATLEPAAPIDTGLVVRATYAGQVGSQQLSNNYASPVAIGNDLYVVDQRGTLWRSSDTSAPVAVLTPADVPDDVTFQGIEGLRNVSPGATDGEIYVLYTSSTAPGSGVPTHELPDPYYGDFANDSLDGRDYYRSSSSSTQYLVLYKYTLDETGLTDPEPVTSFETQYGGGAHRSGGMVTLPDGRILLATGDNAPFGSDGAYAPQDDDEQVGKILLIDPTDGSSTVVAKGIRNVQHMQLVDTDTGSRLVFSDIGLTVAEEINSVLVSDLLDDTEIENFGWGRNEDGLAREGTFYIASGSALTSDFIPAVGEAPLGEEGFVQPLAQVNRGDFDGFFAITGGVASDESFELISVLFSDLVNGDLFATTGGFDGINDVVQSVTLIDEFGDITSLKDLALGDRADPRFFEFSDGSAGVLLESTGAYYLLDEVVTALPLGSSLSFLLVPLTWLASRSRRRGQRV